MIVWAGDEDCEIIANNLRYFGEPVYEYPIDQGVEHGYLAPCQELFQPPVM
jgi:type I site-specific restriction endonuclease